MGFREDHPTAARRNARLWVALIAAVFTLAAAGTVALAATDGTPAADPAAATDVTPAECPQATADVDEAQPAPEDCEEQADVPSGAPEADTSGAEPVEQTVDAPETGVDPEHGDAPPTPDAPVTQATPAGEQAQPDAGAQPAATAVGPEVAAEQASPGVADPGGSPPLQGAGVPSAPKRRAATGGTVAESSPRASVQRRRVAKRRGTGDKAAQTYFPPVSIDWLSLTPMAPPAFGSGEATRFPGPLFLLPIYQAAAVQYRVPWEVLAAINEIETGFGSNTGVSSAGALGWMQFMPATWASFGVDANRDGQKNPHDPVDAIFAAARYLRVSGAARDLPRAIFAYNHANWYVQQVLRRAKEIGDLPEDLLATLVAEGRTQSKAIRRFTGSPGLLDPAHEPRTIGRVLLLDDERLREHVLADERVEVYGCGRGDIAAGVVDRRVLETLAYLASRKLRPDVTSLRCGHGYYTSSGSVSEHSYGAAVDIAGINGTPITGHQGEGSITDETVRALLELRGALRPHQIISLMSYTGASNALAMGDHDDHIHVGFAPLRNLEVSR